MSKIGSAWEALKSKLGNDSAPSKAPAPPPAAGMMADVELVMGIDLGTSCTKVVIGDPDWQGTSHVVPFYENLGVISSYLLPTRLNGQGNLKMELMDNLGSGRAINNLSSFLANVIGMAKKWFDAKCPSIYRQRRLKWRINVGFPGRSVNGDMADAFRAVTFKGIKQACDTAEVGLSDAKGEIYPEIAAQLAGYVNSPFRHRGNLLLIDVGAGTLDVSTIILHGDRSQDVVSFHFCDVQNFGALRLFMARAAALEAVHRGCVRHKLDELDDGSEPLPERCGEFVHHRTADMDRAFIRSSEHFAKEMLDMAFACLGRFRQSQRELLQNRQHDPWGKHLVFFLTGGGSRSKFYQEYLANGFLEERLIGITRWHPEARRRKSLGEGLKLQKLPVPSDLKNFPRNLHSEFDRLSVAYGLAFGGRNLMKVTNATHH